MPVPSRIVTLISADTEWQIVIKHYPDAKRKIAPFGEWFTTTIMVKNHPETILFFHGGWGEIDAAASTQFHQQKPKIINR